MQIKKQNGEVPTEYSINNYPNPFNPTTTINYQIPAHLNLPEGKTSVFVAIKVYDILGKEVATLVNKEHQPGYYKVDFNASSAKGGLTSGVYIYTITTNNYFQSKKMILMK